MADTTAAAACYPSLAMRLQLPLHRLRVIQEGDYRIFQYVLRPQYFLLHSESGLVVC